MQVVDKVFPYHPLTVGEQVFLAFAPHACHLLAPLLHFTDFPLIRKPHQTDKELKKQLILFIEMNGFKCFDKVSVGQMGDSHATALLYSIFFLKSVCYARFIYFADVKTLCTTQYGRKNHVGSFGNQ